MVEAKRQAQALQKLRDRNDATRAIHKEESWWNRGAASEKVGFSGCSTWLCPPVLVACQLREAISRQDTCTALHCDFLHSNRAVICVLWIAWKFKLGTTSKPSWVPMHCLSLMSAIRMQWIPPEHRLKGKGCKAPGNSSVGAADVFKWSTSSDRGTPANHHAVCKDFSQLDT